ncbi:MAG: fused MFS/spermidine synthase [Deltaproteobacteria bacterium]|nr:fused MFS/spermidine synthase [Deltaproteobacteria bacterium]
MGVVSPSRRAGVIVGAALSLWLGAAWGACSRAGAGEVVITERASDGYNVFVVEDDEGIRRLRFELNGVDQSAVKPGDPEHLVFAYMRTLVTALALRPAPERVLVIGIGGGSFPMFMRKHLPKVHIDAVDIDPVVVGVARDELGFREDPRLVVHITDGRRFVEDAQVTYDLIVLDAYGQDNIPIHLATRQFLDAVKQRLSPGGLVAANLWSEHANAKYLAMLRTYEAVFPEVHVVAPPQSESRIVLAFRDPEALSHEALVQRANALKRSWKLRFDLGKLVDRGHAGPGQLPLGHLPLEDGP